MTFLAILLDAAAAICYFFLAQTGTPALITVGAGVQIIITLLLLILAFKFNGRRRARYWADGGYHPFTFRFGIIAMSFIINLLVAALYILYVTGTNTVLFS